MTSLKQQPGADIGIHGSITLAQSLWAAGLVDELRLVVAASVAGHGRRLFDSGGALQRLELLDAERTAGGTVFLSYGRASDG